MSERVLRGALAAVYRAMEESLVDLERYFGHAAEGYADARTAVETALDDFGGSGEPLPRPVVAGLESLVDDLDAAERDARDKQDEAAEALRGMQAALDGNVREDEEDDDDSA